MPYKAILVPQKLQVQEFVLQDILYYSMNTVEVDQHPLIFYLYAHCISCIFKVFFAQPPSFRVRYIMNMYQKRYRRGWNPYRYTDRAISQVLQISRPLIIRTSEQIFQIENPPAGSQRWIPAWTDRHPQLGQSKDQSAHHFATLQSPSAIAKFSK